MIRSTGAGSSSATSSATGKGVQVAPGDGTKRDLPSERALEQPVLGEGIDGLTHDQMIEHAHVNELKATDDSARDELIRRARLGDPRGWL